MGLYDNTVEIARKTMVLLFVVDTSGSMSGAKIGTVNTAIEEIIPELKSISENNADAKIKIATLTFSNSANWIQSTPVDAEDFRWNYLNANGLTAFGAACRELNEKLSRKAFMCDVEGSFAPAIFLLSDGEPTDDYMQHLDTLKQNNWFKHAIKVAIAIGQDANQSILADFTEKREAVLTVHKPDELKKWIQFVTVTASKIGSQSTGTAGKSKQEEFLDQLDHIDIDVNTPDSFLDDDGTLW